MSVRTASLVLAGLALTGCYETESIWPSSPDQLLSQYEGALTNTAMPGALDGMNDPLAIDPTYSMRFDDLPMAARLDRVPWTDTYWPKSDGGITNRWQTDQGNRYRELAPDEVAALTPAELKELSPAEKYDLYVGNDEWSLTLREKARNSPNEAAWTGYCHGWAPAAMFYEEPKPVIVPAPNGRGIPFGSSDIKALLTYFQGEVLQTTYSTDILPWGRLPMGVGSSCSSGRADLPQCHDVNPGALHVLLGNELGQRGNGIMLEADPTYERWNQPVFAYDAQVLGRRAPSSGAADTAVTEVLIANTVSWRKEIEPRYPAVGETGAIHDARYHYTLELDAAGEVVGGQWLVKRPEGGFFTMGEAWDLLVNWDSEDPGDSPDLTRDEASEILYSWLEMPDFAWVVEPSEFPAEFVPAWSSYSFIGGGLDTRRKLYGYFAPLAELYARSIE